MIEVEVKCPVDVLDDMRERLLQIGFSAEKTVTEHDVYFNHPEHDLHTLDQALRIRSVIENSKSKSFVTFKDKKMDTVSMSREEYETSVADGEVMQRIFVGLGYTQTFDVIKSREYMVYQNVHACLDQVEGLGAFLELEILCDADELQKDEARKKGLAKIQTVLDQLGLRMKETTTTSYLSMLMESSFIHE